MLEAIKKFALHASKANFFITNQTASAHALHKSAKTPQPSSASIPAPQCPVSTYTMLESPFPACSRTAAISFWKEP